MDHLLPGKIIICFEIVCLVGCANSKVRNETTCCTRKFLKVQKEKAKSRLQILDEKKMLKAFYLYYKYCFYSTQFFKETFLFQK